MRLFPVRKVSTVTVGSVPVSTMDRRRGGRGRLKKGGGGGGEHRDGMGGLSKTGERESERAQCQVGGV